MTPLAITPGDPGGIGLDLCIQAAVDGALQGIVIADPDLIAARIRHLGLPVHVESTDAFKADRTQGVIYLDPVSAANPHNPPGLSDPDNAAYCLDTLNHALAGIKSGQFSGLVTGPVNKATIRAGGFESFTGHTEYLRDAFGLDAVVMMLASRDVRVALVTTHLPLAEVPTALTRARIVRTGQIVIESFQSLLHLHQPRVHVLGLNPHAGEDGHLGREEIDTIRPAIEELRTLCPKAQIDGPLPADTAFTPELRTKADVTVAMYHDQGLPVVKYQGFGDSVNVTLGLPMIRTSVDHGTALHLAGHGIASPGGLIAAIDEAKRLTELGGV
jgi:4-hydroxythreonine-4-phosphate dehydrogenase